MNDDEDSFVDVEVLVAQLHEVLPKTAEGFSNRLVLVLEAILTEKRRNVSLKHKQKVFNFGLNFSKTLKKTSVNILPKTKILITCFLNFLK